MYVFKPRRPLSFCLRWHYVRSLTPSFSVSFWWGARMGLAQVDASEAVEERCSGDIESSIEGGLNGGVDGGVEGGLEGGIGGGIGGGGGASSGAEPPATSEGGGGGEAPRFQAVY